MGLLYNTGHMEHEIQPLLTITAFARAADAHPNNADKYEKLGELKSVRASDGTRLFRPDDVPTLRALVAAGRARRGRRVLNDDGGAEQPRKGST